jgi:hypothetical protein
MNAAIFCKNYTAALYHFEFYISENNLRSSEYFSLLHNIFRHLDDADTFDYIELAILQNQYEIEVNGFGGM